MHAVPLSAAMERRAWGQKPEEPGTTSPRSVSSLVTLTHWEQLDDGASLNTSRSRAETGMRRLQVRKDKCYKCFAAAFRGDCK